VDHREALQSLYAEHRFAEAWTLYEVHPQHPDPEWHLLGSLAACRQERWFPARDAIEKALALGADGALQVKIRFQHGFVVRAIGEFALAVSEFTWCLSAIEGFPDIASVLRGPLHYNRGLALGSMPDAVGALAAYEAAAKEFRREGLHEYLRMCLQNLAWIACDLRDHDRAEAALSEAAPLCSTESARWHQRLHLTRLAQVRGERTEALRLCEWIEKSDSGTVPADVLSLCACITAEIALDLGLVDLAERTLGLAFDRAVVSPSDSRCLAVVSKVRQRYVTSRQSQVSSGA